ncbi:MAG TPA: phasin family protein [Roseiarcus sp.]|nr:phasin family protein [Roseiarcus sp.]
MATTSKKSAAAKAAVTVEPDLEDEVLSTTEAVEAIVEPALEMQESVRNVLQKGAVETRAVFAKAKASAEDAASAFELSFAAAKDGVVAFNAKAFAAARANAEANFDFLKASMAIRSVPDLVALQQEFARKQTDAAVVQFTDLAALAKKTVVETFEPIKDQVTKAFKIAV